MVKARLPVVQSFTAPNVANRLPTYDWAVRAGFNLAEVQTVIDTGDV